MTVQGLRQIRHLSVLMLVLLAAVSADGASNAHLITLGCLVLSAVVGVVVEMRQQ